MIILNSPAVQIDGGWRLDAFNTVTGKSRLLRDYKKNLLLTNGLNNMALQPNWLLASQVGANGDTPVALNTGMKSYVAGTTNQIDNTFTAESSPPYFGSRQITWRYAEGAAAANLQEIGAGWSALEGSTCVSRALIENPQTGDPVTVAPQPDELLDATYLMRYYPPLGDATGTVFFDGVEYNYIVRAANVTGATEWGSNIGQEVGSVSGAGNWVAYGDDGDIGAIEGQPTGTSAVADNNNQTEQSYIGGFERVCIATVGPTGWVISGGIRCLLCQTTMGQYQIRFGSVVGDNPIPKTSSKIMGIGLTLNWEQKV